MKDFTSKDSGFWNVHILYSKQIIIDGLKIDSSSIIGPSTDGIDIDSSEFVNVKNCITNCNDDSICIKSGRDSDGLRINKPSHDIRITDCIINNGFGVTIGSELSGGVYNVYISNLKYFNTDCGFRIKCTASRKGYVKNVIFENIEMVDVKYAFHIFTNWIPNYCYCVLPKDYHGKIPPHYFKLIEKTDDNIPNTLISNLLFKNIRAIKEKNYYGVSRLFNIEGFADQHIKNITFENCNLEAEEYGFIKNDTNTRFINVNLKYKVIQKNENDEYDNR